MAQKPRSQPERIENFDEQLFYLDFRDRKKKKKQDPLLYINICASLTNDARIAERGLKFILSSSFMGVWLATRELRAQTLRRRARAECFIQWFIRLNNLGKQLSYSEKIKSNSKLRDTALQIAEFSVVPLVISMTYMVQKGDDAPYWQARDWMAGMLELNLAKVDAEPGAIVHARLAHQYFSRASQTKSGHLLSRLVYASAIQAEETLLPFVTLCADAADLMRRSQLGDKVDQNILSNVDEMQQQALLPLWTGINI